MRPEPETELVAPPELYRLVERFDERRVEYLASEYLEARVRIDFINPLFEAIGWDVRNEAHLSELQRDVITEDRLHVGATLKAPDYMFRVHGRRRFVLEAKKPAIELRDSADSALQVRRYGWNARDIGVAVLTNFHETRIYDCGIEPRSTDTADTALLDTFTLGALIPRWKDFASLLSRDAVAGGSLDSYVRTFSAKRGTRPVDQAFLEEIDAWRKLLAQDFARRNKDLSERTLNYAVQATLDRVIFLRICEDRGVEPYGDLRDIAGKAGVYSRLVQRFQVADDKFNSGLFHFRHDPTRQDQPDRVTPLLTASDSLLDGILRRLYWPDGPYDFRVIRPEILGHVYEQFLGKVITLRGAGRATVEEKPEVRKAGGVYYTPIHVVELIVNETLGQALRSHTPPDFLTTGKRKARLRVCDPACGSGTFLLAAYQHLLDWYLAWYAADDPKKWSGVRQKRLLLDATGSWRLSTPERKRILLDHVFGVDIDLQAVEITKLSLLLKVLEGETEATLGEQLRLFHERALPDLEVNIRCGNSLVGSDFLGEHGRHLPDRDREHVNVFDWRREFPQVFADGGFNAVVGNPPWLMAGYYLPETVPYLQDKYKTAHGKFDLYYLFIEKSLSLLSTEGWFGMIVPNKFFHTRAAQPLRTMLAASQRIYRILDYGIIRIFEGATNYSCILFIGGHHTRTIAYQSVDVSGHGSRISVDTFDLRSGPWSFAGEDLRRVFSKMLEAGAPLETLVRRFGTGVQSGADRVLTFDRDTAEALGLEPAVLRLLLRGRDVRRYHIDAQGAKLLIFPYRVANGGFSILSEARLRSYRSVYALLHNNRPALAARRWFGRDAEELSGKWYGMVYLDAHENFSGPHLLSPALSARANFALGTGDLFATGTAGVVSVIPRQDTDEDIRYLLGILNSAPLSCYALSHNPMYQGRFVKFSAPYLRNLPIPRIDFASVDQMRAHHRIVDLVEDAMRVSRVMAESTTPHAVEADARQADAIQDAIDDEVALLFGLGAPDLDTLKSISRARQENGDTLEPNQASAGPPGPA
jgi:hypothetical protein